MPSSHQAKRIFESDVIEGISEPSLIKPPEFLGREKELQALDAELGRTKNGAGGLVLIEGPSGVGKSKLIEQISLRASEQNFRVLQGNAIARKNHRPYQLLESLVASVLSKSTGDYQWSNRLRVCLQEVAPALCEALPQLGWLFDTGASLSVGPETYGENRTVKALAAFLSALGSSHEPALILLDDCHWVDESTLKLLQEWQTAQTRERERWGCHVMIVACYRSEDVKEDFLLRRSRSQLSLTLWPFRGPQVRQLVESMAGNVPDEAMFTIVRLADGNPLMASSLLWGMIETGALVHSKGNWEIDASAMESHLASDRAAALLGSRLRSLPEKTLAILSVAASLGKEFDLTAVRHLTHNEVFRDLDQFRHAFDELAKRHIVTKISDTRYAFFHDKLRETLLEMTSVDDQKKLHLDAAHYLKEMNDRAVFDLAYHYDAAGAWVEGLPYALLAAEQARHQYAFDVAEGFYAMADRGSHAASDSTRRKIYEGWGDVLMLRGKYFAAREKFNAAMTIQIDVESRSKILGKLGELAHKEGDIQGAKSALEESLRNLGRRIPTAKITFFLACVFQVFTQMLHTWFPKLFLRKRIIPEGGRVSLALQIYSKLANVYWFQSAIPTAWVHFRALNEAERYAPSSSLAQLYADHGVVTTMIPMFDRGIKYTQQSWEIRKAHGDVWGQAQSMHYLGIVLYSATRWQQANERLQESISVFEKAGDLWQVNVARFFASKSLYRMGQLKLAVEMAKCGYEATNALGDQPTIGLCLDAWAKASMGHVPLDIIEDEIKATQDSPLTLMVLYQAKGRVLIANQDYGKAIEALRLGAKIIKEKHLRQEVVFSLWPWLATAIRKHWESVIIREPTLAAGLMDELRQVVKTCYRTARLYPNNLPHALRECGLLSAHLGSPIRAKRYLDESVQWARKQNAWHELGQSLQVRGELGANLNWRSFQADLEESKEAFRRCSL